MSPLLPGKYRTEDIKNNFFPTAWEKPNSPCDSPNLGNTTNYKYNILSTYGIDGKFEPDTFL